MSFYFRVGPNSPLGFLINLLVNAGAVIVLVLLAYLVLKTLFRGFAGTKLGDSFLGKFFDLFSKKR